MARRSSRIVKLSAHIAFGLFIVSCRFAGYAQSKRDWRIQRWSLQLAHILGLSVKIHGTAARTEQATMLLANHISWFDIFALNSAGTARFVAKSEVASWPIVGRLCQGTGTLFIDRAKRRDTVRMNQEISHAMLAGHQIAIFPEGTTSDGRTLNPFRSSLLQPAIDALAIIQPVYLRYIDALGMPSTATAYCNDISFGSSLWRILGEHSVTIELHYLPAISVTPADTRHSLTRQIESTITAVHDSLTQKSIDTPVLPESEIFFHHPTAAQ